VQLNGSGQEMAREWPGNEASRTQVVIQTRLSPAAQMPLPAGGHLQPYRMKQRKRDNRKHPA